MVTGGKVTLGIVGYGVAFPVHRLSTLEIQKTWQNMDESRVKSLNVPERAVLAPDEDTITLAWEATKHALIMSGLPEKSIGALFLGTGTSPYVTKASASCLVDMLGLGPKIIAGDCQFSGKSGTTALQAIMGLVGAGIIDYGIAIGSDCLCLHIESGHIMEYTAAAGAASFIIGKTGQIATLDATASYTSDMPDYWRLDGERYFMWGGTTMTSGDICTQEMMRGATDAVLNKAGTVREQIDRVALSQSDGESPYRLSRALGFNKQAVSPGVFAQKIGDCGAASALISLAQHLETAKVGQRLLLVSYGWGAGSDAFILTVTKDDKKAPQTIDEILKKKIMVDYATALKYERKLDSREFKIGPFA